MLKNIITILFAVGSLQVLAQRAPSEFSFIFGSGGMFALPALPEMSSGGFSMDVGGGFTTFFNRNLGFHTGVRFGFSNFEVSVDHKKTITHGLLDMDNRPFDLHSTLLNYTESQRMWFFSVPIMLHVQQNTACFFTGSRHGFYAKGGMNLLLLNSTTYISNIAELQNAGYYPQFGNWLTTQEFAGFGTFRDRTAAGSFRLGLVAALAFETGVKWRIDNGVFLYSGVFVNYALSDPARNQRKLFSDNISPSEDLTTLTTLLAFTDRVNPLTVGITLRLGFARLPVSLRRMGQNASNLPSRPMR